MRHLAISALFLPLLAGCSLLGLPTAQSNPGAPGANSPGGAEAPAAPAMPQSPSAQEASPEAPAGPSVVSVSLKNNCKETVRLFFGEKPKFGSGTYSTLGSNTRTSKSMKPGEMIGIVDESDNGISSFTVSESTRDAEITDSCSGWKG
jgi:hypothetical protein